MAREWEAQFAIAEEAAIKVVEAQFPDLAPVSLEFLGAGFDNSAFLINQEWVFRFPRRPMGVDLIQIERDILPILVPHLSVAIPNPTRIGVPCEEFPYPFLGYRSIAGTTADRVSLAEADRGRIAGPLGQFLRQLHAVPTDVCDAPSDDIRRADLEYRIPWLRERLERARRLFSESEVALMSDYLDQLDPNDLASPIRTWVHGDLYSRHLLISDNRELCGIIDWGDVHVGDPALDLSIAFSFLPPAVRGEFWAAYGAVDFATQERARFRAVLYAIILTEFGEDSGDSAIAAAGRQSLSFCL